MSNGPRPTMKALARLIVLALLLQIPATGLYAARPDELVLKAGTSIQLETVQLVSSKTAPKGDLVDLIVCDDVLVEGRVVVARGTPAIGQISDARAKGAMGMSGRLMLRPLYIRLSDTIVRVDGEASDKGSVTAGAVIGLALLSGGFTGRSAELSKGTPLTGHVLPDISLASASPAPHVSAP